MPSDPATVLVVEDEALIALMVEEALQNAGYRTCGVASTETDALRFAHQCAPRFAVLDINLGFGGSGLNIGRELHDLGTEILYASGNCAQYINQMKQTGALGCLNKPYRPDDVPSALIALSQFRSGEQPAELPATFQLLSRVGPLPGTA